jgi:predicted  nucleic acid-binding Zn-ribbon protein
VESLLQILFEIEAIESALVKNVQEGKPGDGVTVAEEGHPEEGRREEGRPEEGRAEEGRAEEGRPEEGRAQEGRPEEARAALILLLDELPQAIRDQYQWLRTWTFYPIARLRNRACTGCGGTYPESHAFVVGDEKKVTHCEHCLRILVLRDLALVA